MEEINKLYNLRREFDRARLNENELPADPIKAFAQWLNYAIENIEIDATAMVLSTVMDNQVSSRVVLLKESTDEGLVFFSNYQSRKGIELDENSRAAVLFFWKELERQVRIEGVVKKTSSRKSDQYFMSRPPESRLAAVVSNQSELVEDRKEFDVLFNKLKLEKKEKEIKRPPHWGGYVLLPEYFEFWHGRNNRLHDRICYKRNKKEWTRFRLAP